MLATGKLGLLLQHNGEAWVRVGLAAVQDIYPIVLTETNLPVLPSMKHKDVLHGRKEWVLIE
jgi:hypothetical protein